MRFKFPIFVSILTLVILLCVKEFYFLHSPTFGGYSKEIDEANVNNLGFDLPTDLGKAGLVQTSGPLGGNGDQDDSLLWNSVGLFVFWRDL